MSNAEELRERYVGNQDAAREAFEEALAKLDELELGNAELKERAQARLLALKDANTAQREGTQT